MGPNTIQKIKKYIIRRLEKVKFTIKNFRPTYNHSMQKLGRPLENLSQSTTHYEIQFGTVLQNVSKAMYRTWALILFRKLKNIS